MSNKRSKRKNNNRWVHFRKLKHTENPCLCGKTTPQDIMTAKRFDSEQITSDIEEVTCTRCLIEIVKKLSSGIKSVRALIHESGGVSGLHLNDDIATWEELQQGGNFEEWLTDFNIAENIEDAKC